jgi:Histidine kinase-like ATPase domain
MGVMPAVFGDELLLTDDYGDSALARRFTADVLIRFGYDGPPEPVLLVVSELVSNALRHGGGGRLRLSGTSRELRIEVSDHNSFMSSDRSDGWGLVLVDMLTSRWGVDRHPGGKTVWCELSADHPAHGCVKLQYDHPAIHPAEAARR